ncbi:MAG: hypothetical protein RJA36_3356 [Pseudomonadota bacterium]|jgi:hypothetical protein
MQAIVFNMVYCIAQKVGRGSADKLLGNMYDIG